MRILVVFLLLLFISCAVVSQSNSLSGTWNIACDFDLPAGKIEPSVNFIIDWSHAILDLSLDFSFSSAGLDEMSIEGTFNLGDFNFSCEMDLDGSPSFFDGAELSASWPGKQSSWNLLLDITGSPSNTSLSFSGDGNLSFGRWDMQVEMGGCELEFEALTFQLSNMEFGCVTDVEFEAAFDCAGFDGAEISFGSIEIPALDFISVSGAISYELDSKELTTRISGSPDASESCIGIGFKLNTTDSSITGIEISSIDLRCELGTIQFAYVHTSAWDAITLTGGEGGECAVSWTSQIYIKDTSTFLFDVDSVSFNLTYAPCSAYSFAMKTQFAMTGDVEIELRLRGNW